MDTRQIKFEHSPADSLADSFVSSPGTHYPSLFPQSSSIDGTMNPLEALTPPFDDDDVMFDQSISGSMDGSMAGTPAPEKKPVKKRKSWGQQLPEPKTNLPPRKRAKTEDEKEQRRVERVLRNRRAAQSSRERKRQEVEALEAEKQTIERRYHDLEMRLADSEAKRVALEQHIISMTGSLPVINQASASGKPEQYRQASPITLSKELFSSQDAHNYTQPSVVEAHKALPSSVQTVNPASISPEIRPVSEFTNASSSDMTQHPAVVLCDLQCQSEEQRPWMNSSKNSSSISALTTLLMLISATSTSLQPLSQILNSLRTGSSLLPIPSVLNMIIWLVTTPMALTASTSTTSSTTTTARSVRRTRLSLRMNLLRRLLSCSSHLARPLMDATMVAMRSASEQQLLSHASLGDHSVSRPNSGYEPSIECLMTLLWAVQVIDQQRQRQDEVSQGPEQIEAVMEARPACEELDELFSLRSVKPAKSDFPISGGDGTSQKSGAARGVEFGV